MVKTRMFSYYLAEKLEDSGITVNTLHPGLIDTNLNPQRDQSVVDRALPIEQGTISLIRAVTDPKMDNTSGIYLDSDGSIRESSKISYDKKLQQKLWQHTEELIGEQFNFPS